MLVVAVVQPGLPQGRFFSQVAPRCQSGFRLTLYVSQFIIERYPLGSVYWLSGERQIET
jgi:hypothetical protein